MFEPAALPDSVYAERRKWLVYVLAALAGYMSVMSFGHAFAFGDARAAGILIKPNHADMAVIYTPFVLLAGLGLLPFAKSVFGYASICFLGAMFVSLYIQFNGNLNQDFFIVPVPIVIFSVGAYLVAHLIRTLFISTLATSYRRKPVSISRR